MNKWKLKEAQAQAQACATLLIAVGRAGKENQATTNEIITQVRGELRECRFKVSLSRPKINHYDQNGMIGSRPLSRGTMGLMPTHAFDLLLLALESFIQIWQPNQDMLEQRVLIRAVNECCGIDFSGVRKIM